MVINAIELTLLMVKPVAQCVNIKINLKFFPTANLCMNYGLQMKATSAIEIMSIQLVETGWALRFVRNLSGQKLLKLQYDTVEKFVITLTDVISKLNRMVPAK